MADFADDAALLNVVTMWADWNGLAINLNKSELVIFTKKWEITDITLLSLWSSILSTGRQDEVLGDYPW